MNNKILLTVLAIVIVIIAVLGFKVMSSPDSTSSSTNGSFAISLSTNPNPLRPGNATFMIDVKDKNGKPVDNAKVSFDLNMATMNMGKQQGEAAFQGNGRYAIGGRLSMQGPWRVRTNVKMLDGSYETKDFTVDVQ